MKGNMLFMTIAISFIAMNLSAQLTSSFKDPRDGKVYKSVKIGDQTWMSENLAYKADTGCWTPDSANLRVYGYLYSWKTAKKVCPNGWHLPGDEEWTQLTTYLGGDQVAGGKLKETGTTNWKSPNVGATNESGFTAVPAGMFETFFKKFVSFGKTSWYWSSSQSEPELAWMRALIYGNIKVSRGQNDFTGGYSVRCVMNVSKD